ncbi:hypothetical protein ACET3X_004055 [Alternaria dauci]|uniref:Nephrocystin 3-like N-terminal domain-containing protein n=1 Tax=Alternaria dauci TaxID=48095 RepID=A0ABR3UPB4_9PLEO
MVDSSLDHPLFDEAIQATHNTILLEHRQHFDHDVSASLLLNELHRLSAGNGSADRRIVVSSQKFTLFIQTCAPYFDVLGTCVRLQPAWAGYFWGTVRLVFKMSTDYVVLLEKIADMLEAIVQIIPPYQQLYEICKRNVSDTHGQAEDYHLATLLSYVYADLVQLFLELYQIFCRGSQGTKVQSLAFGQAPLPLWRPLDSRFAHVETRIKQHRGWLERETENEFQSYADVSQHRISYLSFLHRQNNVNRNGQVEHEGQRLAKRLRRVEKVQSWLSTSASVGTTTHDFHRPHQEFCAWFLHAPAYTKWRDQRFDQSMANDQDAMTSNWQHRVLFVQAKAGFGKTVISQSVVCNLAGEAEDPDLCDEPPATAYYHFSNLLRKNNQPEDALRTLSPFYCAKLRFENMPLLMRSWTFCCFYFDNIPLLL